MGQRAGRLEALDPEPCATWQAWVDLSASTACGWSRAGVRSPAVVQAAADVFFALMQGFLMDLVQGALEVRLATCVFAVYLPVSSHLQRNRLMIFILAFSVPFLIIKMELDYVLDEFVIRTGSSSQKC